MKTTQFTTGQFINARFNPTAIVGPLKVKETPQPNVLNVCCEQTGRNFTIDTLVTKTWLAGNPEPVKIEELKIGVYVNIKSGTGPSTGPYEVKGLPQKGVIKLLSPAGINARGLTNQFIRSLELDPKLNRDWKKHLGYKLAKILFFAGATKIEHGVDWHRRFDIYTNQPPLHKQTICIYPHIDSSIEALKIEDKIDQARPLIATILSNLGIRYSGGFFDTHTHLSAVNEMDLFADIVLYFNYFKDHFIIEKPIYLAQYSDRWKPTPIRIKIPPPPKGEWCCELYEDELPVGWRPLLKKERPIKGDCHKGPPNCRSGQIWYKYFRDVTERYWFGNAITERPLPSH